MRLIIDIFKKLEVGAIGKESVALIFEKIMKKEVEDRRQAIETLGIALLTTQELEEIISKILEENMNTIKQKQMNSLGLLMGGVWQFSEVKPMVKESMRY